MSKKTSIDKKQNDKTVAKGNVTGEDQNLLGVFLILLDVAKRTNPQKYLVGYKKK